MSEYEESGGSQQHQQQMSDLQSRSHDLQSTNQRKDQEINDLTRLLEEMRTREREQQGVIDRAKVHKMGEVLNWTFWMD